MAVFPFMVDENEAVSGPTVVLLTKKNKPRKNSYNYRFILLDE